MKDTNGYREVRAKIKRTVEKYISRNHSYYHTNFASDKNVLFPESIYKKTYDKGSGDQTHYQSNKNL